MAIVCYEFITGLNGPPPCRPSLECPSVTGSVGEYPIAGKLHVAATVYVVCAENAVEFHRALPVTEREIQFLVGQRRPDVEVEPMFRYPQAPCGRIDYAAPGACPGIQHFKLHLVEAQCVHPPVGSTTAP